MNERQKKIMVPYEELTDTCPDCSEHPCDCGIPAGYQSDIRFTANFAPHIKVIEATKVAEIIKERDDLLRYNEAFRQEALICADCDAISKKEYDQAIEQRDEMTLRWELTNDSLFDKRALADRLAEELTTTRQAHDVVVLAFRKVDAELATVTKQRDRLAEALQKVVTSWDEATWLDDNEFESFRESLQYLNQDHTVAANDMIAAVKGGADES